MDALMLVLALVLGVPGAEAAPSPPCGLSPSDWCASPLADDPCSRHKDARSCRADPLCYGMPYRGESVIACILDERGFASNCPTVGCTSAPPRRD